jgi:hypothetical protein
MSSPSEPVENDLQVVLHLRLAHLHDRALAELLFDLHQCSSEGLALVVVVHGVVEWHGKAPKYGAALARGGGIDVDDHVTERSFDATPPNG